MLKNSFIASIIALAFATALHAQNSNTTATSAQQQRISSASTQTSSSRTRRSSRAQTNASTAAAGANDPTSRGVVAAFNFLIEGIEHANVAAVTSAYWNSPELVLFNNNGTVTRGWEQMRLNRATSYPQLKDVRLAVRDMRVQMLGRDGALISCLWTQTQTRSGASETASGRMTLVFKRINGTWRAVHLHTSPDAPDQSRLLPSERSTSTTTTTTATPPPPPETKTTPKP